MAEQSSLKTVIEKLESLYSAFNKRFYNSELQVPVITVSPDTTSGAYGWCTSWKAWKTADEKKDQVEADTEKVDKHTIENMKRNPEQAKAWVQAEIKINHTWKAKQSLQNLWNTACEEIEDGILG
ncbi:MAG: hypothetical protein PHR06_13380 [Candidatus Cloacimonetes bacterium]|nr:hypothetical protein [Candidatus Cloacimonadota bacterium]